MLWKFGQWRFTISPIQKSQWLGKCHICLLLNTIFSFCCILCCQLVYWYTLKSLTLIPWLLLTKKLKLFLEKKAYNLGKLWEFETVVNFIIIYFLFSLFCFKLFINVTKKITQTKYFNFIKATNLCVCKIWKINKNPYDVCPANISLNIKVLFCYYKNKIISFLKYHI